MSHEVPSIIEESLIIVNRENKNLAAIISSYLHNQGSYLLMFEFPFVGLPKPAHTPQDFNDDSMFVQRAIEFDVLTHNVLHKVKGCKRVILAGLSSDQKTYLSYMNQYEMIEINGDADVLSLLGGIIPERDQELLCKPDQALIGLHIAHCTNRRLTLDENALNLQLADQSKKGLILLEDIDAVSTVIAMNYASSINADVKIVTPLQKGDEKKIRLLVEKWRREKSGGALSELMDILRSKLEGIRFAQWEFVTFFTAGAPYSLYINNDIPCSYVHLLYRPDFFVFNNLFFEDHPPIPSAIIFSTPEFAARDESNKVRTALAAGHYYIRELIDAMATAYNLDMHIRDFSYGLLHISSHGGEIRGVTVIREFLTEDGEKHKFEYDEVATFATIPGTTEAVVTVKWFPRKLDDCVFGSKELVEKNYPEFVYEAINNLYDGRLDDKNVISIKHKSGITDSCHISCADFVYQAGFDRVASGYYSPIVFNNSCWSWNSISHEFLNVGVRGYIGTIFAIGVPEATAAASLFYDNAFTDPIIEAVWKANELIRKSPYKDVYIFYGLHFTSLKQGDTIAESRMQVARNCMRSLYIWLDRQGTAPDQLTNQRISQLVEWNLEHLRDLKSECVSIISIARTKMLKTKRLM